MGDTLPSEIYNTTYKAVHTPKKVEPQKQNVLRNSAINLVGNNPMSYSTDYRDNYISKQSTCFKCGYYKDAIIDINNPSYYRIYKNIILPKIIFIDFDIKNDNNEGIEDILTNKMKLEFNRRKKLINNILEILNDILIYNQTYNLSGII